MITGAATIGAAITGAGTAEDIGIAVDGGVMARGRVGAARPLVGFGFAIESQSCVWLGPLGSFRAVLFVPCHVRRFSEFPAIRFREHGRLGTKDFQHFPPKRRSNGC